MLSTINDSLGVVGPINHNLSGSCRYILYSVIGVCLFGIFWTHKKLEGGRRYPQGFA